MSTERGAREPLERAEIRAREVGNLLKKVMPEGWVFLLILSDTGPSGSMTYLGSGDRPGSIKLLRDLAEKLERGEPQI